MVLFALGLIVGLLLNPAKQKAFKILHEYQKEIENKGETKFFEPITEKEKWENAKSVDDLLDNS